MFGQERNQQKEQWLWVNPHISVYLASLTMFSGDYMKKIGYVFQRNGSDGQNDIWIGHSEETMEKKGMVMSYDKYGKTKR